MKKSKEQKRQEAKERNLQSFPEKVQSFVDVMPGGIAFMSNVYWHDNMLERLSRLQAAARELDVDLNGSPISIRVFSGKPKGCWIPSRRMINTRRFFVKALK